MATITFDGTAKTITIGHDGPITEVDAYEMYSRWKDWVAAGNAQYQPAFGDSVGGNPVSASLSLGGFVFLRNDLGWRIVPANVVHELRINGDIYPTSSGQGLFSPPASASVLIVVQRSTSALSVQTGISGLTPDESMALSLILKILRNRRETDPVAGVQRIYDDDSSTVLLQGDLYEDIAATQPYRGQGADRANRLS